MLKKIILILLVFSSFLFGNFTALTADEVKDAMKKHIAIIDIRTEDEWNYSGVIKGSHKLMFFDKYGNYDVRKWLNEFRKIVKNKNQPFILVCAHANRSHAVGQMLDKQLGYKNVNELKGGIEYGWINKGLKTVK